ncbi:serine/threonine protein kinase [Streptomyces caniscabiei]|uniref:Serine/threonine protein kinase n=1 Tax=Streptomyces caniscabiei TaxID=2746961 RepID=A0A927L0E2_9ACTN|nr:serine/threonine protein kinase [Streptomyces caniscabiei]MBD9723167.1 serine/threonine protein kinase [Streptomyces caniscabiei]MDX3511847.1 serine/threonine protein kinase [Streptomyces caniscabiei]MDX3719099.1 serine/threonine protein kinase [Streptomyces caniscabiei]WEO26753.1 serine/threonine protein kinase [Streptomyces caniscabiei]
MEKLGGSGGSEGEHPLLGVDGVEGAIGDYLARIGDVFRVFGKQDSGCMAYGVHLPDREERWFVKTALDVRGLRSLERARDFHRAVRHPVIVPQLHRIASRDGAAVVMPWRDGEVLYDPAERGRGDRTNPGSPMSRFRALPVDRIEAAFARILDAHLAVEDAGYVAVDLYDGAMLYDFAVGEMSLIDLDEYRPGPFVLDAERLPGSTRFMAPEEFVRGATIDARTMVHALGRTARLLLDAGDEERAWRGTAAQLGVLERAAHPDADERFAGVREFREAWLRS